MKKMKLYGMAALIGLSLTMFAKGVGDENLVLLIDGSGSMKGHVHEIKKMTKELLEKHKDVDIYLFNNKVTAIKKDAIDQIKVAGETDLSYALETLAKRSKPKALILLTDGRPNDPKKVQEAVKKLKKVSKTVICSSFIGNGNKPDILKEISDVSIVQSSLEASLGECLNNAKIKNALPFSFKEVTKELGITYMKSELSSKQNGVHFFEPFPSKAKKLSSKERRALARKMKQKAIIVMIDASGENYSCDALRTSNIGAVKKMISAERLKKEKVASVYMGLFSRTSDVPYFASIYSSKSKFKTDSRRYRAMIQKVGIMFEKVKNSMPLYYAGIEDGRKVHYGKDIVGALKKVLSVYKDEHLDEFGSVEVIIASDMIQSVNTKKSEQMLRKEGGIEFPENVHITILGKQLTCEESYSEADRQRSVELAKTSWRSIIHSASPIDYYANY